MTMQELQESDLDLLNSTPDILAECREFVADELMGAVRVMLDEVDDALFKMADKAENNALQSNYFDAMRDVRMRRPDIEQEYQDFLLGEGETMSAGALSGDPAGLALVNSDELELDLAVHNMVRKVEDILGGEIIHLDLRMAEISGGDPSDPESNPIGPQAVCRRFADLCADIGGDVEISLLILKLFDQKVAVYLPGIYQELNRRLLERGILPKLPATTTVTHPRPQPSSAQAPADDAGAGTAPAPAEGEDGNLFTMLQDLMLRSGMAGAGYAVGGGGGGGGGGSAGVLLSAPQIVAGLTSLQRGEVPVAFGQGVAIDPQRVASGTANVIRELGATEAARDMAAVDQMTIDIVAMIFDYVLGDHNLPDSMKALIGRLQIPVLKVAIFDKEFFAHRHHPARRLLDRLADAAAGWNANHDEDARLLAESERIIGRILDEFDDDVTVFARYLDEFEQFLSSEAQQARTQSEEVVKVISGREKLQLAKSAAAAEVSKRLQRQVCPIAIRRLFKQHLQELLVLHYMKWGTESAQWKNALKLMDALLWSIAPKKHAADREKLIAMLPRLLPMLSRGLTLTALPKEEQDEIFAELSSLHAQSVRSPERPAAEPGAAVDFSVVEPAVQRPPQAAADEPSLAFKAMRNAIVKANRQVYETAQARPQCKGMGTTVAAVLLHDNRAIIGHVGDSRVYRLREGRLQQLTRDHSLVQELIDKGFFTPEEARDYPNRNVVTRMVGVDESVRPDVQELEAKVGDLFLLCSDGLTDMLTDERITGVLAEHRSSLNQIAYNLVAEANTKGGKDNISVVLAKVLAEFPADVHGATLAEGVLETLAVTDTGIKRAHNEDCISDQPAYGVLVLADGMGGANAGEVASAIAVEAMLEQLGVPRAPDTGPADGDTLDVFDLDLEAPGNEEVILSGNRPEAPPTMVDDEWLAVVRGLKVGDWVVFTQQDQTPVRARLTWVSSATGSFLFTNRRGIKVMEATPSGLAIEFKRGTAALLEQVPLFDRAVSSLTEKLGGPRTD